VVLISLGRKSDGSVANITLRGVDPRTSFALRPQLRISEGRSFHSGAAEIVVGKSIARRFAIGGLGETITFGMRTWTVVGIMDSGGNGFESEIWGDARLVMNSFRRPVYSSVIGRLTDSSAFSSLRERVLKDPRLTVEAQRETEYYA
ncbi:MAG TPA: ABC transporter permease, partial [Syntrophobacteraceae bacterium]|nr:ABC transporter permease [Syntrophobacteraceae bacterium]